MGLVIVDTRDTHLRGSRGALLCINHSEVGMHGRPQGLVAINPIDRLMGQAHGSPGVRAILAEVARQVACLWWVMPRTTEGVSLYAEQDPIRLFRGWEDLIVRCVMRHWFPEVGESMFRSEIRIHKDVAEDVDPEYFGALFSNWTRHLLSDVEDWVRGNGGRPWQGVLESRRDTEAEERGYKEVNDEIG